MVLQLLVSAVYQVIRHSWIFSTIAVKYLVIYYIGLLFYEGRLDWDNFEELVVSQGEEAVSFFVFAGFIFFLTGIEFNGFFPVLGQFLSLLYFALLFWKY